MTAKLGGPGGVRAVIAENLLLKQQLIVLRRAHPRAPNLTLQDRLLSGFGSLFPESRTNAQGRDWDPPLDAPRVSSSTGTLQVLPTVLIEPVPEDARTEGTERTAYPGHRRTQVAQSTPSWST
jgi:hypothetical protein